jgi:hypothetical protein
MAFRNYMYETKATGKLVIVIWTVGNVASKGQVEGLGGSNYQVLIIKNYVGAQLIPIRSYSHLEEWVLSEVQGKNYCHNGSCVC